MTLGHEVKDARRFKGGALLQNVDNRELDPLQWGYDVVTKRLEPLAQRYNGVSQGTRIFMLVVSMYKSPIDELQQFLNKLENMNHLYKPPADFTISR